VLTPPANLSGALFDPLAVAIGLGNQELATLNQQLAALGLPPLPTL